MTTTTASHPSFRSLARESALDAAAILLPIRCAGCGAPDRRVCPSCTRALAPRPERASVAGLPVWAGLDYDGVARRVLLAYKDGGRADLAAALASPLRAAVAAAQREYGEPSRESALLPVLIPSTRAARRRRGFHPTGSVLARAHILVPPLWGALRLTRQTADQARLGAAGRAANRTGSLAASARLRGRSCLIVDDIVTSGSTVAEAARAIQAVGGRIAGVAAIARTPRRGTAMAGATPGELGANPVVPAVP
ncbi:phosphoribosyltransferase family protein [Leifsonia sp. F6_8S_P_1B]|uniref:Phosphoribosyltransferase family protein n=1 Tax=Leifsonia williamsii TaxID=3035919 RepID=A0ABT8KDP8_9MICO|nr:phosphoribosyltransferase family protein [Leifsonia williamsii]MDN4614459.1 phosphoribosyltransferase family protein [Leifsonia williamsii]